MTTYTYTEVVLNRREGGKLLGQHAPSTAALGDIQDRIHHAAQRRLAGQPRRGALVILARLPSIPYPLYRLDNATLLADTSAE